MNPYYQDDAVTLYHGDCIAVMRELPDASVDAVVTDPPYGLEFMGKEWDSFRQGGGVGWKAGQLTDIQGLPDGNVFKDKGFDKLPAFRGMTDAQRGTFQSWCQQWATEALRVLKPGGHLLAFGGTRTWHRLAVAIEDAGFEVRDSIAWMYGSGFPKSLDVSKAIDKAAGAQREVVPNPRAKQQTASVRTDAYGDYQAVTTIAPNPATPAAQQWQGWGTALKPAFEPVVVARKPLVGTVAENVLTHGTGALNIDGCRIEGEVPRVPQPNIRRDNYTVGGSDGRNGEMSSAPGGRWPANVILDESQAAELDRQSGWQKDGKTVLQNRSREYNASNYMITDNREGDRGYGGEGGASRFFYTAKADSSERPRVNGVAHPTVKPLDLMRYLVRLVTPPGGTVLEPFAGSGTTLEACIVEGFSVIGIELTEEYLPLITQRITKPIEVTLL